MPIISSTALNYRLCKTLYAILGFHEEHIRSNMQHEFPATMLALLILHTDILQEETLEPSARLMSLTRFPQIMLDMGAQPGLIAPAI